MGRIPNEIPAKSRRPVCPFDEAALTERGLRCVDLVACISRPCRVFLRILGRANLHINTVKVKARIFSAAFEFL